MSNTVELALQYAGRGWKIFPVHSITAEGCCTCKKDCGKSIAKHPITKNGFKAATADTAQIETWWRRWPWANVGIATGASGLVVLDVDGAAGLAELKTLAGEHGPLPRTLMARTGGGLHIYFTGSGVRSSARGNLHVRGEGGYVLAPPSLHRSGRRYEWLNSLTVEPLPHWLREWMQGGYGTKEKDSSKLQCGSLPAYLAAMPQRNLADAAIQAIKQAESTWSAHEEARIRSALLTIPADQYESWVKIGMILRGLQWVRGDGSDIGFDLWDAWSATCAEKYAPAVLEDKWKSFGRSGRGGLGLGTLFQYAQEAGWQGGVDAPSEAGASSDFQFSGSSPLHQEGVSGVAVGEMNGHHVGAVLPPIFGASNPIVFPDTTDAGWPRATCRNARIAIEGMGIACAHDTFHDRMTVGGQVLRHWAGEASDNLTHMLRLMIEERFGFDPKLVNVHDGLTQLCLRNQFDPVANYLDGLCWDGTRRLGTWLTDYLGADDTEIHRHMGTLALLAAVRRVRQPGAKFDQIVVLEGPEGRGKSEALQILAGPENFSDQTILTLHDKEQQEQMEGVWLYEIADLTGISRAEVEKVKAFASRQVDRARPAYGRKRIDRPRRCVFFATTNDKTYLTSQTGNRRFWPIATGALRLEELRQDRDHLWAEAAHWEARIARLTLPEKLWEEAGRLQDSRREVDPWDDVVIAIKGHPYPDKDHAQEYRITTREVFEQHLGESMGRMYPVAAKRLTFAMQRHGWHGPLTMRDGENVVRGYAKPAV